jgi:hypothetical protein
MIRDKRAELVNFFAGVVALLTVSILGGGAIELLTGATFMAMLWSRAASIPMNVAISHWCGEIQVKIRAKFDFDQRKILGKMLIDAAAFAASQSFFYILVRVVTGVARHDLDVKSIVYAVAVLAAMSFPLGVAYGWIMDRVKKTLDS